MTTLVIDQVTRIFPARQGHAPTRALERSRKLVKWRRELMLNPTRMSATKSGSRVSLLVSIIMLALPSWLMVS
ncbi:MAG: hypothetical protein E7A86_37845, partial [Bradyrhizobium sp.]|nr:hypothetical protein [Bradyrhizobium sp.]